MKINEKYFLPKDIIHSQINKFKIKKRIINVNDEKLEINKKMKLLKKNQSVNIVDFFRTMNVTLEECEEAKKQSKVIVENFTYELYDEIRDLQKLAKIQKRVLDLFNYIINLELSFNFSFFKNNYKLDIIVNKMLNYKLEDYSVHLYNLFLNKICQSNNNELPKFIPYSLGINHIYKWIKCHMKIYIFYFQSKERERLKKESEINNNNILNKILNKNVSFPAMSKNNNNNNNHYYHKLPLFLRKLKIKKIKKEDNNNNGDSKKNQYDIFVTSPHNTSLKSNLNSINISLSDVYNNGSEYSISRAGDSKLLSKRVFKNVPVSACYSHNNDVFHSNSHVQSTILALNGINVIKDKIISDKFSFNNYHHLNVDLTYDLMNRHECKSIKRYNEKKKDIDSYIDSKHYYDIKYSSCKNINDKDEFLGYLSRKRIDVLDEVPIQKISKFLK